MLNKIRKFGLECVDLPTMIWNVNFLLRFMTINIDRREKKPISLIAYILTLFCVICYFYAYLFSALWFVFWRCEKNCNLPAAMVVLALCVSSIISTIKLVYIATHVSSMRLLVDQCLGIDALSDPRTRISKYMKEVLRTVKIRAIFFWIGVVLIGVVYLITPVFMTGRHSPEDLFVFYGLEPALESPNYEITYTIMSFSVLFISYTVSTVTALNIILVGYTEAQMISLSKEIVSIWDDSIQDIDMKIESLCDLFNADPVFDDSTKIQINLSIRKSLINCLQIHSQNITLLKNIDEFYNVPNAVAFVCLGVAMIAELLGGLENTYLQAPFTFLQVAVDCFTGQKIMDASDAFEQAVYNCRWEDFDRENQRIVLLMLLNSQKTLMMTAGRMTVMNFVCLMSIVKAVYSTYTTLRTML